MNQFKLFVLILFAFVVAIFAVSNQVAVPIVFWGRTLIPEISLVVIVLGSALFGVLLSAILGFLLQTKLKNQIAKLKKENIQYKNKEAKLQLKIRELEENLEEEDSEETRVL